MDIININTNQVLVNQPYQVQQDLIDLNLDNTWRFVTSDDIIVITQIIEPAVLSLYQCYNNYILFCRSLGLPDKATSNDFRNLANTMKTNSQFEQAYEILFQAQFLIIDIIQNGGTWDTTIYHPEIIGDS